MHKELISLMNRDLQTQLPFAFKGCLGEWWEGRKAEDGGKGEWLSLEVFLAFEWTSGNSLWSFKPYDGSHIPIVVWGSSLGGRIRVVNIQQIWQCI